MDVFVALETRFYLVTTLVLKDQLEPTGQIQSFNTDGFTVMRLADKCRE